MGFDGALSRGRLLAFTMRDMIDQRMRRVQAAPAGISLGTQIFANEDDVGLGGSPGGSGSSLTGQLTVAASSTLDHVIGDATAFQAAFIDYAYLRNANRGAGKAYVWINNSTAAVGGGRDGEEGEDASSLTFKGRINGGVFYVRLTNSDGANAVDVIMSITAIPIVS